MSTDCENLLKKFLVLNPQKRLSLEVRCITNADFQIFRQQFVNTQGSNKDLGSIDRVKD